MSALPNEQGLLTTEDAAAKERLKQLKQLAQFRRRVSRFGTSNGPAIDRYTASCRGWARAMNAAIGAYYGQHVQNGALPQETFIRIAREIFEPRLQRYCSELLDIACGEQCLDQVSERCDDIVRVLAQLEQAWTSSSLISRQPQVFPAMNAVETAIKRLDEFQLVLAKQSPPVPLITAAVAKKRYHLSRKTLYRRIADGQLTDHREPGHGRNATLRLDENEIRQILPKKK